MFEQLTILAPGLLGASVAQAVSDRGLARRVVAWSRRGQTRVKCEAAPWCARVFDRPEAAVEGSDLVVVCSPVETIHPLVKGVADSLEEGALVTDVGSTKSLICRRCHASLVTAARDRGAPASAGPVFVGAHPMAGSEKTGMEHASAGLFQGQTCFVTPLVDTPAPSVDRAVRFWRALGMEVATLSPETHDEIVANISHLPHLLATTLCSYLASRDRGWLNYAGNGLRDTTRVAAGSPTIWKEIIEQNREEIIRSLSAFENELQGLKSAIANHQTFEVLNLLERGKVYRERLRPPVAGGGEEDKDEEVAPGGAGAAAGETGPGGAGHG